MNSILDRAKAHYDKLDRETILVPEWGVGDKPLVVTFSRLTIAERSKIFKADANGNDPDGPTACVRAVILKACDEKGDRMFNEMDRHALTHHVDSDIIGRIAKAILGEAGGEPPNLDDVKNG